MHTSELPFPGCISLRQTGAAQDQWIVAKRHEEARQLTSIFYQFLQLVEKLHRYGKHEEDYFELIGRDNERKILQDVLTDEYSQFIAVSLRLSFYSQRGNTLFPTWEHFIPNVGIIVTLNGDSESA